MSKKEPDYVQTSAEVETINFPRVVTPGLQGSRLHGCKPNDDLGGKNHNHCVLDTGNPIVPFGYAGMTVT
ncbi:MAG: hypothetical protein HOP23_10120 [Methylococcaceae bacterium]|nr:hypothetical protein [Methylococcaceae bacterium]